MAEQKERKGWPIARRGQDMEQAVKQQQAADGMNLQNLAQIKARKGC
jgi:hypothetical protein